jgi:capsular exopolysaccharide synthesis family protein
MVKLQAAIQSSQGKLRAEIGKIVLAVHSEYEAALEQERSLVTALDQQKREALAMNRKAIEYGVLARDVESGKQIYQSLLQRAKETDVAGNLKTGNIRVVDEAERPRAPVTPNPPLNLMVGLLAGLGLAIGVAFLFEYLDSTLKSPEEVKACLGVPSLGMIPALGDRWTATAPLLHTGVPPNFAEMMRAIRTNVLFSSTEDGLRTLAVTSTGPGEGKTLVASNLAVAMALAGQRVLLVDCDLRRSRVHELFGLDQEPGLSNVLVGNAKASEAVHKTEVAGLWVLPSGRTPPNPAELLSSTRFKDMVRSLGEHFDAVIIDTPPAIVVADPAVVSSVASGVLFVVGAEMTSRHAARAALEQLRRGRVRILGAILNKVQLERDWYYYSRYYRPEYATYHEVARP